MTVNGNAVRKSPRSSKGWRRHIRRDKAAKGREERERRAINHPASVAARLYAAQLGGREPKIASAPGLTSHLVGPSPTSDWRCVRPGCHNVLNYKTEHHCFTCKLPYDPRFAEVL